jgi:hypothetical protein
MTGDFVTMYGSWFGLVASIFAVLGGLVLFTRWARNQFRNAVLEDIKPLVDEIGLSVNNIRPGEPRLIERVKAAEQHSVKAAQSAELAKSMGEANGIAVRDLTLEVKSLAAEVQIVLGHAEFGKK